VADWYETFLNSPYPMATFARVDPAERTAKAAEYAAYQLFQIRRLLEAQASPTGAAAPPAPR
jgi:hypothetical protein